MTETQAEDLVRLYVEGWKANDKQRILQPLASKCVVTESHGPTFRGLAEISKWVDEWVEHGNSVTKWDIDSFFFTANDAAFFEWSFACIAEGEIGEIEGASVVLFKKGKIDHIHEYRMTGKSSHE